MTPDEEIILIREAKEGNSESLSAIIKNYAPKVRSLARKCFLVGGSNEDLQQEGLLAIINAVRTFDIEKSNNFGAYVTMCVRSKIIDTIRSASRDKHKALNTAKSISGDNEIYKIENLLESAEPAHDPISAYVEMETRENFYTSIKNLLNGKQLTLLQLYFDGYSYGEIAEKLGISVKKVDNTLNSIKTKLKKTKNIFN